MMSKMHFKPSDLKSVMENEPVKCKIRIAVASVAMAAVTSWYQHYFDNLAYRSNQYQMAALGGKPGFEFNDYVDTFGRWSAASW